MQSCDGELKMQETQIIRGFLFPANQQASRAVGPRVRSFHNPSARFTPFASRHCGTLAFARNVRDVLSTLSGAPYRLRVVPLIRAKMLLVAPFRRWTFYGDAFECCCDQLLIVHIRTRDGHSDGNPRAVCQHRALDTQLASICRVFPGFFPHPVAPWSSPRLNSATSSRFPSTRHTPPRHAATAFRTRRVEPIPENTRGGRCSTRTVRASHSTGNLYATRREYQSSPFASTTGDAHL